MMIGGLCWSVHAVERLMERCGITPHEFVERTDPRTLRAVVPGALGLLVGRLNSHLVFEWNGGIAHVVTVLPIKDGAKKKIPAQRDDDHEWQ